MKIEVNLTEMRIRPDLARSAIVALLAALPTDEAELALLEWSTLQDLHARLQQQGSDLPLFIGPLAAGRTLPLPDRVEEINTRIAGHHAAKAAGGASEPVEPAEPTAAAAPKPPQPGAAVASEPAPLPPPVKPVPPPAPPPFKQPIPLVPPPTVSAGAAGATTVPITVPPPTAQPAQPVAAAVPSPPPPAPAAQPTAAAVPPPTAVVAAPDPVANGADDEPEETRSMPLRDLCRYVEDRHGRQMLMHVLKDTYGASTLKELGDKADAFRGDLVKLLVPY